MLGFGILYTVGIIKSYIVLLFVCIYSVYKTGFKSGPHGRPPVGNGGGTILKVGGPVLEKVDD